MYRIHVDEALMLVEVRLVGVIREEEMRRFIDECLALARSLTAQGRTIRVLSDMRQLKAASPEATETLRHGQQVLMGEGIQRIAQIVDSELTALQLNRVARASGMDRIMRRFADERDARRWLMSDVDDQPDSSL